MHDCLVILKLAAATNAIILKVSHYSPLIPVAAAANIVSHTMNHTVVTMLQILYLIHARFVLASSPCFAALQAYSDRSI